jgi:UDP-GlcNAc:undecaprenyl-phosphate GlcNAc-1-phosphate transferase
MRDARVIAVVSLVFVAALALSSALVPVARLLAHRTGILDVPGPRKVHRAPTPRLGGVAVFVSFTVLVVAGYVGRPQVDLFAHMLFGTRVPMLDEAYRVAPKLFALVFGAAIAFTVGLADDSLGRRFPVAAKVIGQLVAAALLVGSGVRTTFLPGDAANVVLTVLWLVGITNAFNLLDNMDGLSAGVALVAAIVLFINAWALGEFFICLVLAAFAGSLLGFLLYNFEPASIFLGDCGSLFIGYVMASLTLLERYVSNASSSLFPILMPVLVLAVPILDTATVTFIRLRERRPIYVGDMRHLSHRLVSLGFSPRAAVVILYLMTFGLGLGAASLTDATPVQAALVLLQSATLVALIMAMMFVRRGAIALEAR